MGTFSMPNPNYICERCDIYRRWNKDTPEDARVIGPRVVHDAETHELYADPETFRRVRGPDGSRRSPVDAGLVFSGGVWSG